MKESIHTYYERLRKAFKEYSGKKAIEPKDMLHFVFRFVERLRPEIGQMIKSHLICWPTKQIDEVLQYAKYCNDEIELKQKKLKEKAMVMQIKAAQTGVQGAFSATVMFQPQILKKNLELLELPYQSTLVQYINDLLNASKTRDECKYDPIALLNHLGKFGHKVSPLKLQYCQ
ncbi:hypothetical protein NDU88_011108 [Pleurodeles waltl]|uniref:Uncharacterized protein n=1 Tax=Pleurodeles waltl TaxID=8319 RepID=A0AAV7R0N1_PLEWA|nr:hypothetical protein NDU88_011108 [Pleurodeles waltl]